MKREHIGLNYECSTLLSFYNISAIFLDTVLLFEETEILRKKPSNFQNLMKMFSTKACIKYT